MLRSRVLVALLTPAAVATFAGLAPAPAASATCAYGSGWKAPDRAAADRVIVLVNQHRAKIGAGQLGKASVLTRTAEWKSGHMAARGYFSHEDQGITVNGSARSVGQRLDDCNYSGGTWAENIAFGQRTPAEVMQGWLNSPGHRQNLENPRLKSIGVGVVAASNGRINWTQMFGDASVIDGKNPPPPASGPAPAPKPAPKPAPRPGTAGNLPVLAPGVILSARPRVQRRSVATMRFSLSAVRRVRLAANPRRAIAVRVHCNGKRVATARGRRGRAAVIARKLPAGRCAFMVQAGGRTTPVAVSLRTR